MIHELAPADEEKYLFFPSVVGAVVPVVNLPGLPGDIAFTPEALAGIYLGKIKKWNDPILTRAQSGPSPSGSRHCRRSSRGRQRHQLCLDGLPLKDQP